MNSRRRHARQLVLATAAISVALVAGSSSGASADPASDGLWYYDLLHVQAAHDAGITGKGVTVAVIDSPINLKVPTLADADIKVTDTVPCFADGKPIPPVSEDLLQTTAHGTNVASLIVGSGAGVNGQLGVRGVAPGVKLRYYVSGGKDPDCEDKNGKPVEDLSPEIDKAVADGANIISMSVAASYSEDLATAIGRAERAGVLLVIAVSNQQSLVDDFPIWSQLANGVVSVQSADRNGQVASQDMHLGLGPQQNVDSATDVIAPGVGILVQGDEQTGEWDALSIGAGTSYATPIVAGFLADVWQKYPHATANQLIQTLIHNTGVDDHPLTYDESHITGYGFVSLTHMLRVDPTQYPDVNPLVTADGEPSPALISKDSPSPTPYEISHPDTAASAAPLIIAGVIGGIVLLGVVVLIVVIAARRGRSRPAA